MNTPLTLSANWLIVFCYWLIALKYASQTLLKWQWIVLQCVLTKIITKTNHIPDANQITEMGVLSVEMDLTSINSGDWAKVPSHH
jgi:hypothetical protein